MIVSLDTGIEKVSYVSHSAESESDFPQRKVYLPISASIPSHLEEVFNLYANARALENMVTPKISNKYVTTPSGYSRLFEEIEAIGNNYLPKNGAERQAVQAAQVLFGVMKENFQSFNIGRSTLIQG